MLRQPLSANLRCNFCQLSCGVPASSPRMDSARSIVDVLIVIAHLGFACLSRCAVFWLDSVVDSQRGLHSAAALAVFSAYCTLALWTLLRLLSFGFEIKRDAVQSARERGMLRHHCGILRVSGAGRLVWATICKICVHAIEHWFMMLRENDICGEIRTKVMIGTLGGSRGIQRDVSHQANIHAYLNHIWSSGFDAFWLVYSICCNDVRHSCKGQSRAVRVVCRRRVRHEVAMFQCDTTTMRSSTLDVRDETLFFPTRITLPNFSHRSAFGTI